MNDGDGYRVRIVFVDRARLEFSLSSSFTIDRTSTFKLLDRHGNLHQLSWGSQTLETLEISDYLETGVWFVRQLGDRGDSSEGLVQQELQRIRTARAVHLRTVRSDT